MSSHTNIEREKTRIKRQLEFVKWLQDKGLYNHMESADTMQKMHKVWEAAMEDSISVGDLYRQFLYRVKKFCSKILGYRFRD